MRVLITGITGFAGSHLADLIHEQFPSYKIFGSFRWRSPMDNIHHLGEISAVQLIAGDLTDPSSVRRLLDESKPDLIFHLAAQSFVGASFGQPRETLSTNINPTVNLLHGLREKLAGAMFFAGTSEEYGMVQPGETPIRETNQLLPLSPYGVSKVAGDLLCYQYHRSYGVHVVRGRAFNHEGARRGEVFATSNFAKQIAEIELGRRPPVVKVGNLEAVRDYTHVRDTVEAYWRILTKGEPGEVYNVASAHCDKAGVRTDRTWKIREVLDELISQSTMAKSITVQHDPERDRPSDVPLLSGDFTKLNARTGWEPSRGMASALRDLLGYWRVKVRGT